ncbi:hypothetical protein Tco_0093813 [Tanacetum coccineum]
MGGDYGSRIESNSQSIAKVGDMVLGLSTQLTNFMKRGRPKLNNMDDESDDDDKLEDSGCSLVDLIGNTHQYSSRLTKIEFPRNQVTPPSWKQYVKDITSRFGAPYDDPMSELMELKQTGSVTEVHDKFDCILSRLQLPPKYALSCFMSVLNEQISSMVRMFKPSTIQEEFSLAKLYECTLQKQQSKQQTKPPLLTTPKTYTYSNTNIKPNLTPKQPPYNNKPNTPYTKPNYTRTTLTAAEMADRRSKGLCFICDEKYSFGHICIEWFVTLGRVTFDFDDRCVEFKHKGRKVVLRGSDDKPIQTIDEQKMRQTIQHAGELCMLQVLAVEGEEHSNNPQVNTATDSPVSSDIQQLVQEYTPIFQDPVDLPPFRPGYDHQITLKDGSNPVNLRPYRRFIKDYGGLAKPLTQLLKKDCFQWSTEAEKAFQELKQAVD